MKFIKIINVFRKGYEVADPTKWKHGQITINMLAGLLIAVVSAARAYGYELPVSDEQAVSIAGGLLTAVNVMLTVATSKKVGLPADPVSPWDAPE